MANYLNALRLFSRDVRLYLITAGLVGFASVGGIYATLLNLYLLRLGHGPKFIGLVNAVGLLGIALFALPSGMLGTRWGVRRMMIIGPSLMAVGYVLLPLAEFIPAGLQPAWLLGAYGLSGLGQALYFVNGYPYLMQVTGLVERNHAFSVHTAALPMAGFVGSLVAGFLPRFFATNLDISLDQPAPYRYPLLAASFFMFLAVLTMMATRAEAPAPRTPRRPAIKNRGVIVGLIAPLTLIGILRLAGEGAMRTFFNVYLDDSLQAPTVQIGFLLAIAQLVAAPAALVSPVLMNRWGKGRVVVVGALGIALSVLSLALIPHWIIAGLGLVGVIALTSASRPAYVVFALEIVPQEWQATVSGVMSMAVGVSWSTMALGGGYVVAAFGYQSLFLLSAAITTTGALFFWSYFRVPRGEFARKIGAGESRAGIGD